MTPVPFDALDPRFTHWVPAVVAPARGWAGMAGYHRGSRYLLESVSCAPTRAQCATFDSRAECLEWMMANRAQIANAAPGTTVRPVDLSRWLLGLD